MQGFTPKDLLSFERMLSISLVKIIYGIGLVAIALFAVITIFRGLSAMSFSLSAGLGILLVAALISTVGILAWRITCELWIVVFGIYDRMGQLRDALMRDAPSSR